MFRNAGNEKLIQAGVSCTGIHLRPAGEVQPRSAQAARSADGKCDDPLANLALSLPPSHLTERLEAVALPCGIVQTAAAERRKKTERRKKESSSASPRRSGPVKIGA